MFAEGRKNTAGMNLHGQWRRKKTAATIGVAVLLSAAAPVAAQVAIPPTVEPTRPQQGLEEAPVPKSQPRSVVPLTREQATPEEAADFSFVFQKMNIEGAEALSVADLMSLWPHTPGTLVTVADVIQFANDITRAYGDAGYALSFGVVPEQDIKNGVVLIRVIEGFVDSVEFVGANTLGGTRVGAAARKIAANLIGERPLRTVDLERYVLLINDLTGLEIKTTLVPSETTEGGSVLRVETVSRRPIKAEVGYSNAIPETLDRHAAGGSVEFNGLGITGTETLRFAGWRSIWSDAYWSASGDMSFRIGTHGFEIGASGSYSNSDPEEGVLESLDFLGQSLSASVYAAYPVIRTRSQNLTLRASASLSNSETDILDTALTRDRLRTIDVSAAYDFSDAFRGLNYVRFGAERGLSALNARGNSRANGDVEYTSLTLDVQRDQPLFRVASGQLGLRLAARGQSAIGPQALFSGAECVYGGRRFGRRYDAGVLSGDHCALGSAELSWRAPSKNRLGVGLYGFADIGLVRQKGLLEAGEERERSAASAGAGVRVNFADNVSGIAEASWALKDPTGTDGFDNGVRVNAALQIRY